MYSLVYDPVGQETGILATINAFPPCGCPLPSDRDVVRHQLVPILGVDFFVGYTYDKSYADLLIRIEGA